jgi:2'-5' RNA ligase
MGAYPLAEGTGPPVGPATSVRAFFGLPLPDAQRVALAQFVAACAERAPEFRWTPAANLHLTLRFVGQVERSVVEEIADRLGARSLPAFDLEPGDLGTFKRGRLVRVVWLGLRTGGEAAKRLAAEIEAECVNAGLDGEKRPFRAHLTLARARPRDGAVIPGLPEPPHLAAWRASQLVLYSSRLGRTGSVYEPLRVVQLD